MSTDADAPESAPGFWERFLDNSWLERRSEDVLEADLPIVDPHHHIWERPMPDYPVAALLSDLHAGHRVVATVYLEAHAHYRTDGPEQLRPVGETEYVASLAGQLALTPGAPAVAAGMVGHAGLAEGAAVQEVLEAHIEAGGERFKGVRAYVFWDEALKLGFQGPPRGLARDPTFREGFARLAPLGLVCDVMAYHTNLAEVTELALEYPNTRIIVNHLGAPLGRGPYAQRQAEVFETWRTAIQQLARLPNVYMKIGGLCGPFFGVLIPRKFREKPLPPSSEELASAYRPWFDVTLDAFGSQRCMFESNFPADKYDCSYLVLWNAFKRLAAGSSKAEKNALFSGTATQVYSLKY